MKYPYELTDDVFPLERDSHTHYGRYLGICYFGFSKSKSYMGVPWNEKLLASKASNALHGGVVTTLMDEAFGGASMVFLGEITPLATIDLRIDYIRPATAGQDLYCIGECYRKTKRVCFVRGQVFQNNPDKPIAFGTGTFMIGAYSKPKKEAVGLGDV